MVSLINAFRHLSSAKVLVIGDFMLDAYTYGKVSRVSPEGPVPILSVNDQSSLPGGAGNVVLNLRALGAEVKMYGRVGDDHNGRLLKELFLARGVRDDGLLVQENYLTPIKNRFIADSQQLIRIDFEKNVPLELALEEQLMDQLKKDIPDVDIIAISDYGKGVLSDYLLQFVIHEGRKHGIPVIVDPKGDVFGKYTGATMIKPNGKEAYAAAKCPVTASIDEVAKSIFEKVDVDMLLITRSEKGMVLFDRKGKKKNFPVVQKAVKDVTGAGDTALAMVTFAYANHVSIEHAIKLANIASGVAIEKVGCVSVTLSEIAQRLLQIDAEGKIFDEKYLFVLKQALWRKKVMILHLLQTRELHKNLFQSIKKLGQRKKGVKLIVYLEGKGCPKHVLSLLSSMPEVDFLVKQSESLEHLCSVINPQKVFSYVGQEGLREIDTKLAVV